MRVLVTGARLPAALEIASGLNRLGVEVFAADSLFFSPAGASCSIIQYLRFPSPRFSFNEFRIAILGWVDKFKIDLIIPVSEEIFYLAKLEEELRPICSLFSPSFSFLRSCHSKWDILELAKICDINVPQTMLVTSAEEARCAAKNFSNYILKPEFSRGAYDLLFDVTQIEKQNKISVQSRWLVQEYITGHEICSYSIAVAGALLAHAVYEPAYRVGLGASLYFKPIENSLLRDYVSRFVKKHSLTGQISFDFLVTKDGHLVLLECNPRATSGIHLVAQSETWCRAFLGEKIVDVTIEDLTPRAAKFPMILLNSKQALRENYFLRFISDLWKAKDTIFSLRNPLPFFCFATLLHRINVSMS